jgi:hypothetical protein
MISEGQRLMQLKPDSLLLALGSPQWVESESLASATSSLLCVCACV